MHKSNTKLLYLNFSLKQISSLTRSSQIREYYNSLLYSLHRKSSNTTMTTFPASNYNELLTISRDELDAFTKMRADFKRSKPTKIAYDNIVAHRFHTHMKANPRPAFNQILAISRDKIETVMNRANKHFDKVERQLDNWSIQSRFLEIDVCLHCQTTYRCDEMAFEDTAIHSVSVSIVAYFDAKNIYGSDKMNVDVFRVINELYRDIRQTLHA